MAVSQAPRSARAAAFAIDLALRVGPFLIVGGAGYATTSRALVSAALPLLIVCLVAFTFIDAWGLARCGQSIGKRLLGLRVVRESGADVAPWRILGVRTLVPITMGFVPYLGILWLFLDHLWIFGAQRRAVHDLLADTVVTRA